MSTNKKTQKNNNIVNGIDLSPREFISYGKGEDEIFKILRKTKNKLYLFDVKKLHKCERAIENLFHVEKNIRNETQIVANDFMKDNMRKKLSEKRSELNKMKKLFAKVKKA